RAALAHAGGRRCGHGRHARPGGVDGDARAHPPRGAAPDPGRELRPPVAALAARLARRRMRGPVPRPGYGITIVNPTLSASTAGPTAVALLTPPPWSTVMLGWRSVWTSNSPAPQLAAVVRVIALALPSGSVVPPHSTVTVAATSAELIPGAVTQYTPALARVTRVMPFEVLNEHSSPPTPPVHGKLEWLTTRA